MSKEHSKKPRIKARGVTTDMTAMCDVAFLLLTFFILTTNFKPAEPVTPFLASSISDKLLPENNVLMVTIDKEGTVYFGVADQNTRQSMLARMAKKYDVKLSQSDGDEFLLMSSFGVPMSRMKKFLSTPIASRSEFKQTGIPCDSANNELKEWILSARYANKDIRVTLRGDQDAPYPVTKKVIDTFVEQGINRFSFVTSQEMKVGVEN